MIKIEKVNKYFNRHKKNQIHIIDNTSLTLGDTGLIAILGESGSGKTTLLNAIGGLDKVNKGKIYINGKKITHRRMYTVDKIRNLNMGYIFQDYKLLEHLSVFDNIALSLKMLGLKDKTQIEERVNYVLEAVNMIRYKNRPASMLSGGEKQRVAIARAIVKNPSIVIADEPTGNLDSKNSLEVMNIIKAISKKKLVILVTHEVELAKFYATRIIELQDGKILKDYENEVAESLEYKLDNKIYLKDFENKENFFNDNVKLEMYSKKDEKSTINIKIAVKDGNIYIQSLNNRVEVVDENSAVEFVDDYYKKIDKSIYEKYDYNLEDITSKKYKPRYASIYGIFKSLVRGFKRVLDYSILKKILLVGFFASSLFIVYGICNIAGVTRINEKDFITMDKNYLRVEKPQISVEEFLNYEDAKNVDYILPGNGSVSFKFVADEYIQTSRFTLELSGTLVSLDKIQNDKLVEGRMPDNEYEILVDVMHLNKLLNDGFSMAKQIGIKSVEEFLDKKVTVPNLKPFKIVGLVDNGSPSIYVNRDMFVNLFANTEQASFGGFYVPSMDGIDDATQGVKDYKLYLDDITLVKGNLPTEDYEVIINNSNRYEYKLNKPIKEKVNGRELIVVGYYESKTNSKDYFVNNNTVKYSVIEKSSNMLVYPDDKLQCMNELKTDYKLNVIDNYEREKDIYVNSIKDSVRSAIILAGIILAISLIEIFLMIRSSFLSRIKEIGVLRAIGVKKLDIYRMFFGEIFAITTMASLPGVILMTYILKQISSVSYLADSFVVNGYTLGLSVAIIYGFNILIGILPIRKVIKKRPAEILSRHDI